jgi:hypothetical protein
MRWPALGERRPRMSADPPMVFESEFVQNAPYALLKAMALVSYRGRLRTA